MTLVIGLCADAEKEPAQDSFVEKLIANVIKNLEVTVTNIHVRFEDSFTNPKKPFSVGVTLRELSLRVSFLVFLFVFRCLFLLLPPRRRLCFQLFVCLFVCFSWITQKLLDQKLSQNSAERWYSGHGNYPLNSGGNLDHITLWLV